MKMLLIIAVPLILACSMTYAQQSTSVKVKKGFLALSMGTSFPMGDFVSKSFDNEQAGFAELGYAINLLYGREIHKGFGIALSMPYCGYKVAESLRGTDPGVKIDHWQYYGLLAGPMFTFGDDKTQTKLDFRMMGGVTNVNSPKLTYHDQVEIPEEWSATFAWQFGTDIRLNLGKNIYFIGSMDYNNMKPTFKGEEGEFDDFQQRISALTVTAGIGIKL